MSTEVTEIHQDSPKNGIIHSMSKNRQVHRPSRGGSDKDEEYRHHRTYRCNVDDGSTVTDFLPAERARGITIQSAAITFHWPPHPPETVRDTRNPTSTENPTLPISQASHTINLIDTPGHADFTFEVLRSLRILDGAVCILDGVAGVEAQTEKVWHQASNYHIPSIIYVNKLDRDGATFGKTVKEVGSKLHGWPAVCQIPWWEGGKGQFIGVGDVVALKALRWTTGGDGKNVKVFDLNALESIEPKLAQELRKARAALVELLSEYDEELVEKFLEHGENHVAIPPTAITESLRRCLLRNTGKIIPVFAGASFRNIGVQPILDAIIDLLPDPTEALDAEVSIGSAKGGLNRLIEGKLIVEGTDQSKAGALRAHTQAVDLVRNLRACALAFKVVNDPRRGVLVYVRVYSGTIHRNVSLFNTNLHISERAPRLLKMYASDAVEVQSISAGQIGVIVGLRHARTGDTLVSYAGTNPKAGPPAPLDSLQLRPIDIPPPVFFASMEPHSLSEEKHLGEVLAILLREDPSLQVSIDPDSGQTLLSGMGELHLEIARDRLVEDFKAKASMGKIEVGYREYIRTSSPPEMVMFDRETAGKKGKAGCTASVVPLSTSADITSLSSSTLQEDAYSTLRDGNLITISITSPDSADTPCDVSTRPLPSHLSLSTIHTSLTNGALAALARGPQHSFPLHSTHVKLTFDPATHVFGAETTSAAMSSAARLATQAALKSAAAQGGTALMEPVMNVIISVDEASLGAVVHDISASRGGHIISLNDSGTSSMVANNATEAEASVIDVRRIYAPPDPFASPSVAGAEDQLDHNNRQRTITARVPLKEMVGYLKHLRSLTGGRGTFVMSVDRFERMGAQREKVVLQEMRGMVA
ncbi:MAG: Ribosome-releasing factor 2, mitochondrial [Pleopsidium flavum]|nr:MAG: Ribosome-releasing factor 2, mitochondrial [Pleopsidium flavum]